MSEVKTVEKLERFSVEDVAFYYTYTDEQLCRSEDVSKLEKGTNILLLSNNYLRRREKKLQEENVFLREQLDALRQDNAEAAEREYANGN